MTKRCYRTLTVTTAVLLLGVLFVAPTSAKERAKIKGPLENLAVDLDASGKLKLDLRPDRSRLDIKLRRLDANAGYDINVGGIVQATVTTNSNGAAKIRFEDDETPALDFDPRGRLMTIESASGAVLGLVVSGPGQPDSLKVDERTEPASTGAIGSAKVEARFRSKKGRDRFKVQIEDVPAGDYELFVGGVLRATIQVGSTGRGEVEFDSEAEPPKLLLDFDPRGAVVDVVSGSTIVATGPMETLGAGANSCQESEVLLPLVSTGLDPDASGDARFRVRSDCDQDFRVQIEDVPVGTYDVVVAGAVRGTISVVDDGFEVQGEIEFDTDPDDPHEVLLDFDPRGQTLEVVQGASVFFSTEFDGGSTPPTGCMESETTLPLLNAGVVPSAKGEARFRERDDCDLDFRVEIEDLPLGDYDLFVDGVQRATITVVDTGTEFEGDADFDSDPDQPGELLLDFDPIGALIEVSQGGVVLLSRTFDPAAGGGAGGGGTCAFSEIDLPMVNTGAIGAAKGDARFRERVDCDRDFRVQVEDVPLGDYDLFVAGVPRGTITVVDVGGKNEGQIEFDTEPNDPGEILLDFDPRGQTVEIRDVSGAVLTLEFPAS
jgi:hypothetical protein